MCILYVALFAQSIEMTPYLFSKDYSPKISNKDLTLVSGASIQYKQDTQNFIFDFSRQYIKYRSSKKDTESDFTFTYNFDDKTHMNLLMGLHLKKSSKNNSALTDIIGDGTTLILGGSQNFYNSFNHKITIGSNFYATYYKEGIDDLGNLDKIFIYQVSPFIQYKIQNTYFKFQADYLKTPMYIRKDSGLLHAIVGFSFGKFDAELSGFYGKAKSVVFSNGHEVINTKDEYEQEIKARLSYNFTQNLKASAFASQTDIIERLIDSEEFTIGLNFSYIFKIPTISF